MSITDSPKDKKRRTSVDNLTRYLTESWKESFDKMGNNDDQKASSSEDPTQILATSLNLLSLRLEQSTQNNARPSIRFEDVEKMLKKLSGDSHSNFNTWLLQF